MPGNYSKVCGRISAIQKGEPDGFKNHYEGLSSQYVDGLTIRHGSQYNEGHIWTFASSISQLPELNKCPCTSDRYPVPHFVGSHYFCERQPQ